MAGTVIRAASLAFLIAVMAGGTAPAQESRPLPPAGRFLFLNQERILTDSVAGRALLAEEAEARDRLRAEARSIEQAFEAEERALTEARATMEPEAFRELADDFDARVVQARRDQDARSASLAAQFDQRRRQFYADVAPVLVGLLERFGAVAIFDEGSVLLADQSLNITDAVIAEIDAREATEDGQPEGAAPGAPDEPGGPAPDEEGEGDR
jgi:Skp family chaperone for outer membrane proteins